MVFVPDIDHPPDPVIPTLTAVIEQRGTSPQWSCGRGGVRISGMCLSMAAQWFMSHVEFRKWHCLLSLKQGVLQYELPGCVCAGGLQMYPLGRTPLLKRYIPILKGSLHT